VELFKTILVDKIFKQWMNQSKLFLKLPEQKQTDINLYVDLFLLVSLFRLSKDNGGISGFLLDAVFSLKLKNNGNNVTFLPNSENELMTCEALCEELYSGFTRKEQRIAYLIAMHAICFGLFRLEIIRNKFVNELNEDEKKLDEDARLFVSKSAIDMGLGTFGFGERIMGELASYNIPVKAKKQNTTDKWLSYQKEYATLVIGGRKPSEAQNKIRNEIADLIENDPEKTPFKKTPDRATVWRQLVEKNQYLNH